MDSKFIVILYVFFINLYITKNSVINSVTNRLTDIWARCWKKTKNDKIKDFWKINFCVANLIIDYKKIQTLKSYTAKFY